MRVEVLFADSLLAGLVLTAVSVLLLSHFARVHHGGLAHFFHAHHHAAGAAVHAVQRAAHAATNVLSAHHHAAHTAAHSAVQAVAHGASNAAHAVTAAAAPRTPSWLWPAALSVVCLSFGAAGLASLQLLGLGAGLALAVAVLAAVVSLYLLVGKLGRVLAESEAAGATTGGSILGLQGHVAVDIPAGQKGSVAFVRDGRLTTIPARAHDGGALARDTVVVIVDIHNHVAEVAPFDAS